MMKPLPILVILAAAVSAIPALYAQTSHRSSTSYSIHTPSRKYDFALVDGKGSVCCWGTWDSSTFKELTERTKAETLYVKKGEDLYAITDRGIVSAAHQALEPMMRLGKQQGELGRQQGEFGRQQGELGKKQGEYGRQMGEVAREHNGDTEMKELSKRMEELGKEQRALGEKQKELGGRQSELGKKQGQAAKEADETITKLIDDAFARGLARKI